MFPRMQSARGYAAEDPEAGSSLAQIPSESGALQTRSVAVGETAATDSTETGDDHYNASSAGSQSLAPVHGSDAPSSGPSSRPIHHPKHRVRAQDPYTLRKPSQAAHQDSKPSFHPFQDPQTVAGESNMEDVASLDSVGGIQLKTADIDTMDASEGPEQTQWVKPSLQSTTCFEQSKLAEYVSEIRRLKYELEQKDRQLEFLRRQKETQDACVQADYLVVTADAILSKEILAETVIEITGGSQQSLAWLGHGLRLTVPSGAVPYGKTISLAIKALLSGEFDMPDDCHLVSAIYWFTATDAFEEDIIIHLEHCAIIDTQDQCTDYRFLTGSSSKSELPYVLRVADGGLFTPHSDEASISVRQFSFYAAAFIGEKQAPYSSYIGHLFYRPFRGMYVWQLDYVIMQYIPSLLSYVQNDYESKGWTSHHEQRLEYDKGSRALVLRIAEPRTERENWDIIPLNPPQVTKWDADHIKRKSRAPYCRLAIKWRGEERRVFPDVSCRVDIKGAKHPYHFFSIQLPEKECTPPLRAGCLTASPKEVPLEEKDLPKILMSIQAVTRVQSLGLKLGLLMSIIRKIQEENQTLEDQKTQVICYWIKRIGIVRQKKSWQPTWSQLADAVGNENLDLARQIRETYCKTV